MPVPVVWLQVSQPRYGRVVQVDEAAGSLQLAPWSVGLCRALRLPQAHLGLVFVSFSLKPLKPKRPGLRAQPECPVPMLIADKAAGRPDIYYYLFLTKHLNLKTTNP